MTDKFNKTVLIAPLDWGLGHATRCIPVIKAFQQSNWNVVVATDGACKALLQKEFNNVEFVVLKGYNIHYAKKAKWFLLKIFFQIPKILRSISYEKKWLNNFLEENKIDLIISDNRYGFYSNNVPSIFITHQLLIKAPLKIAEFFLQKINYHFINRFKQCWVADAENDGGVAGELSHPKILPKISIHYLGILSRFEKKEVEKKYDYCIILSGPEEQRIVFEKLVMKDVFQLNRKILLVRGRPNDNKQTQSTENVTIKNHLAGNELQQAIQQSEMIISRSGYTTVMELLSLQAKSILIATPQQTEQEYLSKILLQKQWCYAVAQKDFGLQSVISAAKGFNYQFPGVKFFNEEKLEELLFDISSFRTSESE